MLCRITGENGVFMVLGCGVRFKGADQVMRKAPQAVVLWQSHTWQVLQVEGAGRVATLDARCLEGAQRIARFSKMELVRNII
jgi:hypothetical protein